MVELVFVADSEESIHDVGIPSDVVPRIGEQIAYGGANYVVDKVTHYFPTDEPTRLSCVFVGVHRGVA